MRDAIMAGLAVGTGFGVLIGLVIAGAIDRMLEGWDLGDE